MQGTRSSHRHKLSTHRIIQFTVITFKDMEWKDDRAVVVDLGRQGVGVETPAKLDPGFIWFKDKVGGFRAGVLMWSRPVGTNHRAGIRLVQLTQDEEQFIEGQISLIRANKPLDNPVAVMTTIMEALTDSRGSAAAKSAAQAAAAEEEEEPDVRSVKRSV
ncbi:MAG: hypothetical protein M0042_06495 [Nitrospiraceae bacterium]|nr:hypothetical protein [Nitrospiraceae bacterium]